MDEYGITSPVQLKTADQRKEFFNKIKNEWPKAKRQIKEHYLRLHIRKMITEELKSYTLKKGSVVKQEGIPVELEQDTDVLATPGNIDIISQLPRPKGRGFLDTK